MTADARPGSASRPLTGRVALVTGAGRGLGRAYALALAARGARVMVNNRSAPAADETVQLIADAGGEAAAVVADLASTQGARSAVEAALDVYGQIDIVVNNAGGVDDPQTLVPFASITDEGRDEMIRQNFLSTWAVTAAVWPHLQARGYGRVVMTASPVGLFGSQEHSHYAAAKGATVGLATSLALEGAEHAIAVNVVSPIAFTRAAEAIPDPAFKAWFAETFAVERVAAVVAWLADEACRVSGEVFSVGGPRVARAFVGETRGFVTDAASFSADAVGDHVDDIRATDGFLQYVGVGEMMGHLMEVHDAPPAVRGVDLGGSPDDEQAGDAA